MTIKITAHQRLALHELNEALRNASDAGLLDELQANVTSPDSINDVCDTVAYAIMHDVVPVYTKQP